jgi:leucyl aminopeptidase
MDVQIAQGRLQDYVADAIIVYAFESVELSGTTQAVDQALEGAISALFEGRDFNGKSGQVVVLYPRGFAARRVIIIGLGNRDGFTAEAIRRATAQAILKARDLKVKTVAVTPLEIINISTAQSAEATVEGALLAAYQYHGQKSGDAPEALPEMLTLVIDAGEQDEVARGMEAGKAIADGVALARDLVNMPPNICTPAYMADAARSAAQAVGLKIDVLERKQMEALGMGALLGVAQGSDTPPRFIIMEHNADKAAELDTIVLVGKGVTFDTGGYSLKERDGMVGMKADMAGGAAVIGALRAVGALDVPLHVVGLVPAADNMVSGHAYRPQDVLKASNGVTIEIISTDAEGRLLLADALVFASRYKPAAVIDIATLTGACVVALGTVAAGVFCNNDRLRDELLAAANHTGEKIWPLPMFAEYDKAIESQTADVKNSGGRYGGASTAAAFLKHFVDYPAWAHIDMAGLAGIDSLSGSSSDNPYIPAKGATGYGVRLLTDFVRQWRPLE